MEIDEKARAAARKKYFDGTYCGKAEQHINDILEAYEAAKGADQPDDLTRLIGEVRRRFTALRLEVDSSIVDDIENSFNDLLVPIIAYNDSVTGICNFCVDICNEIIAERKTITPTESSDGKSDD